MKQFVILCAIVALVLLAHCSSQRELAFDYPPNADADSQSVFVEHFKKGHVLYDLNCAKCHTQQVDGRAVIPDFSVPQLMDYAMRFEYAEHQDRLREVDVSIQELDDIQTFLRYKKPSGVPAFPDRVPVFMRKTPQ